MCGIAGFFRRPDERAVAAMLGAMGHRGPDGSGRFADETVALGHLRLAIIDLSPAGAQPMADDSGDVWITFNGEIYNWREERQRLEREGVRFRSHSDTEVLLALYRRHGDAFVERLRGIFAFAIYDRSGGPGRERLLLARDHFGVKPLLYAETGGSIVFASELKGMLASGRIEGAIDGEALRTLVTWGSVIQPRTLLAGVAALPAAHRLVVDHTGMRLERYWSYADGRDPSLARLPYPELVDRADAVLGGSVAAQLVADVPVGAFLSGGIDSALIVALMARAGSRHIKTFSVGFEAEGAGLDETDDAAEVAAFLGTDHTRVVVTPADVEGRFAEFVRGLDQPSVDGFNSFWVSDATAGAVKVALSGTGSDELFAGYPWFAAMASAPAPRPGARAWLDRLLGRAPADDFLERYARQYCCFGPDGPPLLLAPHYAEAARLVAPERDLAPLDTMREADVLERTSALCLDFYTRGQLLRDIDACSMIHSLEVRVPFLDPQVAALAFSLPAPAKLRPGGTPLDLGASYDASGIKRIVVDVARRHLPARLFTARHKRGFAMPFEAWMRGPLKPLFDDALADASLRREDLFEPAAARQVWEDFLAGRVAWNRPWLLAVAQLWCRHVRAEALGARPRAAAPLPAGAGIPA